MKRKKSKHNKWADHYTLKAKKEHFPARSVYKLKEIQKNLKNLAPEKRKKKAYRTTMVNFFELFKSEA